MARPRGESMQCETSSILTVRMERRLPSLARGWHTPDPSPSRSAADLSSCKPRSWWLLEECPDEAGDDSDHSNRKHFVCTPQSQNERGRTNVRRSHQLCNGASRIPTIMVSRTPSPESHAMSREDSSERCTPAACFVSGGTATNTPRSSQSGTISTFTATPSMSHAASVQSMLDSDASYPATSDFPPPPPPPPPFALPEQGFLMGFFVGCASIGSVNHPFGCADLCKYAKKTRGCKDGLACTRCHLCPRRKPKELPGQQGSAAIAEVGIWQASWSASYESPGENLPSVGSLNHPHGCADFCKFPKKPKGCKDGAACVRCHICTCKKKTMQSEIKAV